MQCQACKQSAATIHLTEITEGQRSETHLCEACAQKQGISMQTQIPINELLSSLLAAQPQMPAETAPALPSTSCPGCGSTFEQFKKQSLLGCPEDYSVFEKQLEPVIKKSHAGHDTHCGKVPAKAPDEAKKSTELIRLKQELELAVKVEDYELAARIRDRIKQLQ
ncbi:MAG: hypothetical protein A2Y07_07520 [Planctomycetes bacterium GWF2_50_10]|nr:MAG: hypothetical protein A2Y07_07520 [Planctomycetes bacterium GWF2_50_10]